VKLKPLAARLPGISWIGGQAQRLHVQFSERAAIFEPYFDEVLEAWLERKLSLPPDVDLALCAITAEFVIDPDQLHTFLCALQDSFLSQGCPWIIWPTQDGGRDARRLSDLTVICIGKLEGTWPGDWGPVLDKLNESLLSRFPRLSARARMAQLSPLQALLRGAAAKTRDLTGVFQHHVLGLQRMTPPERSHFARIEARLPIAQAEDAEKTDDEMGMRTEEAIERIAVNSVDPDTKCKIDFDIIDKVQTVLSNRVRGGYGKQRRHALDGILRWLEQDLPLETAIVLGFPVHLLTTGTLKRKRASMRNVRSYPKSITAALKADPDVLRALLSEDWNEVYEGYQRLLASPAARTKEHRKELRKAAGAFRAYLTLRFEALFVPLGPKPSDEDVSVPVAILLDDASKERLIERIERDTANERVKALARCMLEVALDVPARISDFWKLRLSDALFEHGAHALRFQAHRSDDRAKTGASAGTVEVIADDARQAMAEWLERRDKETSDLKLPLFGDGFSKPTMTQAMEAYKLLNRLLKEELGDRRASFQTLRHTAISNQAERAFRIRSAEREMDPIHEVSVRARHAAVSTTLRSYTHLYAEGLRLDLDRLLFPCLSHRIVARWTGLNESTLSKRARGRDSGDVWAEALRASASRVPIPGADQGFSACSLGTSCPTVQRVSVIDVLYALECIGKGETAAQVSLRSGLNLSLSTQIEQEWLRLHSQGLGPVEELHWGTPKLAGLVQVVNGAPGGALCQSASQACMDLVIGEYLDASSASRVDPVLRLARHAQYPPALILLRSDDVNSVALLQTLHLFALRFGAHPGVEIVEPERTKRPGVYLMFMSQPVKAGEAVGPRNACTKGFIDLMAGALVHHKVFGRTPSSPTQEKNS